MSVNRFDYYQTSRAEESIPVLEPIEGQFRTSWWFWALCCGYCLGRAAPRPAPSGAPTVVVMRR